MARKDVLTPYQLLTNQSLASSFQSVPTMITFTDNIGYQINIVTSDSTGSFYVQGSVDYQKDMNGNVTNAGNWVDLTLSGGIPTAGAANDQIIISLNQLPFNAIRLRYAPTINGTGTCNAFIMTKQVGG